MPSAAQRITVHFGGDWHGTYGAFPTPGHSKQDRGTTVTDGAAGQVVFGGFNGGDWRELQAECRKLGLVPELNGSERQARDVAHWDYTDVSGRTLYRKVRIAGPGGRKGYRFEHPDGQGGWLAKRGSAAPVPYRLHELAHAPASAILYMAEGEKQADRLASWDLLATSSKDWRAEFAPYVSNRTIVILPDNDPEGARIAADTKAKVEAAGARVVLIALPGLPHKGDIVDWSGNATELAGLVESALNPPAETIALLNPAAWIGLAPPQRLWALNELIPAAQVAYLTGAGATGKSLLAQQLATCMALGLPLLGVETVQASALYLTCEDDAAELHRRQLAICEALNVTLGSLSDKLHLASLAGAIGSDLSTFDPLGRMATTAAWAHLRATVLAHRLGFIVLDNVAHLFAGNENIRNQVAAFLSLLNGLAAESGAAILLIGHPNKAGDSFSGSTAWENQVRSRLFLERPRDGDGSAPDPDARELCTGKANYAGQGAALAFRWHRWAFVRDTDLPPNVSAEISANVTANVENEAFLRCLAKATEERRATSPNPSASNYAPRVFAKMTTGKGIAANRYAAALERLLHLGLIRNGEPLWQRDNRAWVSGLGLAPTPAPTPHEPAAPTAPTPD